MKTEIPDEIVQEALTRYGENPFDIRAALDVVVKWARKDEQMACVNEALTLESIEGDQLLRMRDRTPQEIAAAPARVAKLEAALRESRTTFDTLGCALHNDGFFLAANDCFRAKASIAAALAKEPKE